MPGAPKSRVALPSAHLNCGLRVSPEKGNVRNPTIHLRWILAFETIDWSAISDYQSTGTYDFSLKCSKKSSSWKIFYDMGLTRLMGCDIIAVEQNRKGGH